MFALEIAFQDGVSAPEMIFVRRPQAIIGASDYAHVVVDDLREVGMQLRLVREIGRSFRCIPTGEVPAQFRYLEEKVFQGEGSVDIGPVRFYLTALDSDLLLRETEPPDRAGVRILRQACASAAPLFPAVVVSGAHSMVVSFAPDQPIYVGRSRQCALRLDSADISAKHARMGYEAGEFWIEDLGSTNGTFVNQQQISGRVSVPAGVPVILGREISLLGVTAEDQIVRASQAHPQVVERPAQIERKYPILVSASEVARPARLVLSPGGSVKIGRDPSSDMWLGAPHVSRQHCLVKMGAQGEINVVDSSTNGTAHDEGVLHRGEVLQVGQRPRVFDFGGGVTVAICFSDAHEQAFMNAHGATDIFLGLVPAAHAANVGHEVALLHAENSRQAQAQQSVDPQREPGVARNVPRWRRALGIYHALQSREKMLIVLTIIVVLATLISAGGIVFGVVSRSW